MFEELQCRKYQVQLPSSPTDLDWQKPPQGKLKCNTDVAFFNDSGKSGFGCVLRDGEGNFVQGGLML